MQHSETRTDKRLTRMFAAWNIAVPAAIGSVPILAFMAINPPPYAAWDGAGYGLFLVILVTGIVAGLTGPRPGSIFIVIALSFWVAQSFAGWFASCTNITSSTSCGPGAGAGGLLLAALTSLILGVGPLAGAYRISSRGLRPDPGTKA